MTGALPLKTIGICGIGQMGAAAAVCFQRAGYNVLLWARNPDKLRAVSPQLEELRRFLNDHVSPAPKQIGSVDLTPELESLASQSDLVMDAIGEIMEHKIDLFTRLRKKTRPDTIFITTTSGLSITQMARLSGCERVLAGTHFWNPPHLMPLVEVVRGDDTPAELIERICRIIGSIGKIPVRVNRDVPGFIGNRLLHAMWREAIHLVEQGVASPQDIDRVARLTFGLRAPALGPLENMDLVGLDLVDTIHQYLLVDLSEAKCSQQALSQRVADGRLGMKSGGGFRDWTDCDARQTIERRDRQIVHQLQFLRDMDAL